MYQVCDKTHLLLYRVIVCPDQAMPVVGAFRRVGCELPVGIGWPALSAWRLCGRTASDLTAFSLEAFGHSSSTHGSSVGVECDVIDVFPVIVRRHASPGLVCVRIYVGDGNRELNRSHAASKTILFCMICMNLPIYLIRTRTRVVRMSTI